MRRFLASILVACATVGGAFAVLACESDVASGGGGTTADAGTSHRDGTAVEPPDAAILDSGPPLPPVPSCSAYCDSVMDACKDAEAQYISKAECLGFCARFDVGDPGDTDKSSLA